MVAIAHDRHNALVCNLHLNTQLMSELHGACVLRNALHRNVIRFLREASMSVAGILASGLFSNAISHAGKQSPSPANLKTGAQSVFGTLQQNLLGSGSSSSAAGTSVTAQLSQVGQDLSSGNLPAAQADFSAFKVTLAQHVGQLLNHSQSGSAPSAGSSSSSGASSESSLLGSGNDPLAAAMLAYGSLQQGAINGALNASVSPTASTFSINA
jgi:hypothetical protein